MSKEATIPGLLTSDIQSRIRRSLDASWPLENASVRDASNKGSTLTNNAGVTAAAGPTASIAGASQFARASSQYFSVADSPNLSGGDRDFTIWAWVYKDSTPAANSYMGLISKWITVGQREYNLSYANDATSNAFYFGVSADGTAEVAVRDTTHTSPATGTWFFVLGWHDSVANTINIQVNNGVVDSAAHATGVLDGTDAVNIGLVGGATNFWDGPIAAPGKANRVLTTQERAWLSSGQLLAA